MHRVRLLRAGVPEPQPHHHAAPADRAAPRDGAPGRRARRCSTRCSSEYEYDGDRDLRRRRHRACTPARWRSTPASWSRSCARREHGAARAASGASSWRAATERLERAGRGGRSRLGGRAARLCAIVDPAGGRQSCPFTVREGAAAVYLPVVHQPDLRQRPRGPGASVGARGAGGDLDARRAAAVDPRRRDRALLRAAVELEGLPVRARADVARAPAAALARWTDGGELPVVSDATSCTHASASPTATARGDRGDRLDRVGPRPAARAARGLAQARQRCRAPDLLLAAPRSVGQARGDRRRG